MTYYRLQKCLESPTKCMTELKKLLLDGCFYSIAEFNELQT